MTPFPAVRAAAHPPVAPATAAPRPPDSLDTTLSTSLSVTEYSSACLWLSCPLPHCLGVANQTSIFYFWLILIALRSGGILG